MSKAGLADLEPVASDSLLAADRAGQRRPPSGQDRCRSRRVPRRGRQHADPQGDEGSRAAPRRYAGHQGLSRQRGRQALRRIAAPDPARRACRRRADRRIADARRVRRAAARLRADRDGEPEARVFLGTPSWPNHAPIINAVRPGGSRLSLLRARSGDGPVRGHDRRPRRRRARRRRAAPRLLPQSDRSGPQRRPVARGGAGRDRARSHPLDRHCLPGIWPRPR